MGEVADQWAIVTVSIYVKLYINTCFGSKFK